MTMIIAARPQSRRPAGGGGFPNSHVFFHLLDSLPSVLSPNYQSALSRLPFGPEVLNILTKRLCRVRGSASSGASAPPGPMRRRVEMVKGHFTCDGLFYTVPAIRICNKSKSRRK